MTLKKLAELTGTTTGTVSKAFAEKPEISKETKNRIFEKAKELGCFDKYYKGERKRRLIGIICPEPESEVYGTLIGKLEKTVSSYGADALIGVSRFSDGRLSDIFYALAYRAHADGVIIIGSAKGIKNPDALPIVCINQGADIPDQYDMISVDLTKSFVKLIELIKDQGYKKVGFIGEDLTVGRLELFKHTMRTVGLPLKNEYISTPSDVRFAEAGIKGMQELIDRGAVPEIIITAYDNIAYGAMQKANEYGYRIPEDISFVGINDISTNAYAEVPLASISLCDDEVCEAVVKLILERIENRHPRHSQKTIPAALHLRKSLKIKD